MNQDKLAQLLEDSKSLLEIEDNFDGEGSPAIKPETLNRAHRFLSAFIGILGGCETSVVLPDIQYGPNGSIDLYWAFTANKSEFLINVPSDPTDKITYCGIDGAGNKTTKGSYDEESLLKNMTYKEETDDYELRLKAINLAYYIFYEEFKKDYIRKSNEITQEMDNIESNMLKNRELEKQRENQS